MILPAAFIAQLRSLLGQADADAFFNALQGDASVSIRMNLRKVQEGMFPLEAWVPWCPQGRYLSQRPSFTLDPRLHAGAYYVQEASSMFLWHVLRHCVDDRPVVMLDLCAAPGGKSTLACDALPEGSLLVSNEVMRARAQVLAENLTKWGNAWSVVTHNDPADFSPLVGMFDLILVDAPCSGEGMFRKDAGAVNDWSLEAVEMCARRQRRILADIWPCLKPGGWLIYSTCTYNLSENEEQVRWLRDEWGACPVSVPVPSEWGITGCLLEGEDLPVYRFLPHKTRGEGFFLSVLQKPVEAEEEQPPVVRRGNKKGKSGNGTKDRLPSLPKEIMSRAANWLHDPDSYVLMPQGTGLFAFPLLYKEVLQRLRDSLYLLQAGVPLAEVKGRDLLPTHALAMSTALRPDAFPRVEVSAEQALAYLRREAIVLSGDAPRGFVLLTCEGLPIGFVKNIGNRANNLYPAEWRIRKSLP